MPKSALDDFCISVEESDLSDCRESDLIAILIIFAVMLTRRVMQDAGQQTNPNWWLAALLAVALGAGLLSVLFTVNFPAEPTVAVPADNLRQLGLALVDPDQFAIPFEVASVLLIASMIGAIVVAGESAKKSAAKK